MLLLSSRNSPAVHTRTVVVVTVVVVTVVVVLVEDVLDVLLDELLLVELDELVVLLVQLPCPIGCAGRPRCNSRVASCVSFYRHIRMPPIRQRHQGILLLR